MAEVWSETRIVRQRHASRMQAEAVLMQTTIASVIAGKAGQAALNKLLQRMSDVG